MVEEFKGVSVKTVVKAGEVATFTGAPIRVVVALCLTCCREKDDYDPGSIGGVARLYPHIMVMGNCDLSTVDAEVELARPAASPMGMMKTGSDQMGKSIGTVYFTDTN